MKFFDSHAHYTDKRFLGNRDELLANLFNTTVKGIVNVGYDKSSNIESITLAKEYDNIYCAIGVHPEGANEIVDLEELKYLKELATNHQNKVVAIGEIGLDYHYDGYIKEKQKMLFSRQIEIANEVNLPIIIHCRDSYSDTLEVIKNTKCNNSGVFHCFGGSVEIAKVILDLGYYISFAGPITFKNANHLLDVVKYVPMDRILIETDCPYLSPHPLRGQQNDSSKLIYIAEKISELKELPLEAVSEITLENTKNVFRIILN